MPKNTVQRRARAKRDQEKQQRRRARRMRQLRIWGTVVAAVALGLVLFLVFRSDGKGTVSPGASSGSTGKGPAACGGKAKGPYAGKQYKAYPKTVIDSAKTYTAKIETSCGTITAALDAKGAPKTVNSFVFLAREKYFDNTIFHRVIPGFVIQGGDPKGTGSGGPGYQFKNETQPDDAFEEAGVLAMANAGPDTNGSQFYITDGPAPHLKGGYTIFGKVLSGLDVVTKITKIPLDKERPKLDVVVYSITIQEK